MWKDYDEMEENLSIQELTEILSTIRKKEERQMQFQAALQGVDLKGSEEDEADPWERIKAKAFAGTENPDDILSLRGRNAASAGFGIGLGLDYEEA
jgi:hypothetical protein